MKPPKRPESLFRAPQLNRRRVLAVLIIAVIADGLQLVLGPSGWAFADQIIDAIVMLLTSRLIGFHWLLLPSFILELFPLVDEFPTWTACVIAVIALRRREQRMAPPEPEGPTIEI